MRFFTYIFIFSIFLTNCTPNKGFGQELKITNSAIHITSPKIKMGLNCSGSYSDSECSSCNSNTELINISLNIDCPAFLKAELTFDSSQNANQDRLTDTGLVRLGEKKFQLNTNSINLNQIFRCKTQNKFKVKIYFNKSDLAEYLRTNNLLTPKIYIKRIKYDESLTLIKEDSVILEAYTKLKLNDTVRKNLYDFQPILIKKQASGYSAEKSFVNDDCKFNDNTDVFSVLSEKNRLHNPTGNFQTLEKKHLIIYYDSTWDEESIKNAISYTNDFFSRNKAGIELIIDSISDVEPNSSYTFDSNIIYIYFKDTQPDSLLGLTTCVDSIKKIEIYSTHNPTTLAHEIGHYFDLLHTQCEVGETCSQAYICASTTSINSCIYNVENESTNLMYPSRGNNESNISITVGQVYKLNTISANCTDGSSPHVNLNISP